MSSYIAIDDNLLKETVRIGRFKINKGAVMQPCVSFWNAGVLPKMRIADNVFLLPEKWPMCHYIARIPICIHVQRFSCSKSY